MKLQQLRYVWEVAHHKLNVSATAQNLYTSQPGISKQIRLLEDELGVEIFTRSGKHFTKITAAGEKIIEKAGEVLRTVDSIKQVSQEFCDHDKGTLTVAATYVQARYTLPRVIRDFTEKYPNVALHISQGSSRQIIDMVVNNTVDFAITADNIIPQAHSELMMIPCYHWKYAVLVPNGHPLAQFQGKITLKDLQEHPLVTYVQGGSGRTHIDEVFSQAKVQPNIVFTAADADVIKTYIRLGLGVGIVAKMAYNPAEDSDLTCIDVAHFISSGTAQLCVRSGTFFRAFMLDFIKLCANHLTKSRMEAVMACHNQDELQRVFAGLDLVEY